MWLFGPQEETTHFRKPIPWECDASGGDKMQTFFENMMLPGSEDSRKKKNISLSWCSPTPSIHRAKKIKSWVP